MLTEFFRNFDNRQRGVPTTQTSTCIKENVVALEILVQVGRVSVVVQVVEPAFHVQRDVCLTTVDVQLASYSLSVPLSANSNTTPLGTPFRVIMFVIGRYTTNLIQFMTW